MMQFLNNKKYARNEIATTTKKNESPTYLEINLLSVDAFLLMQQSCIKVIHCIMNGDTLLCHCLVQMQNCSLLRL